MDESPLIISREEIEGLRRSLAIGNGLPSDQIRRLLTTCYGLLERLGVSTPATHGYESNSTHYVH